MKASELIAFLKREYQLGQGHSAAAYTLQGRAFLGRAAAKLEWQGLPVSPVAD
jgi:hypothetical protein